MRENIAGPSSMDTLSFNGFQAPYNNTSSNQKSALISVSSDVYYGYQPLRVPDNSGTESMHTESFNNSFSEMETTQCDFPRINRKRKRDNIESRVETWKKRRQNGKHCLEHCQESQGVHPPK